MADDNRQARNIEKAQDRKDLSIAWFNANNAAIEMVKLENETLNADARQIRLRFWRSYFLAEQKEYRETVIASLSATFKITDAIERLNTAKNLVELKNVWVSLTEDERREETIKAHCTMLKQKYESA